MVCVKKSDITRFYNCRILKNHKLVWEDLWVRDGKILDAQHVFYDEKTSPRRHYDCKGLIVAPGFIDIQINGGFGVDFAMDVDTMEEGVEKVANGLLMYGVTAFLPTVITSPPHIYKTVLPKIVRQPGTVKRAEVLGVHVEGPFISPKKKGAHPVELLRTFSGFSDLLDVYGSLDNVSLVTLAPELEGSAEIIKELRARGIHVSLGHSEASILDGEAGMKNGARCLTHLFNAMTAFHHRDPGLMGVLTSRDIPEEGMFYGIIADGIHTHPAALRAAYRINPEGLILVTDAFSALGLKDGRHTIGQQEVEVKGKRAVVAGTDTLVGAITTLDNCVRHLLKHARCSVVEALESASLHPAQAIGITDKKGMLEVGRDADLVLVDDDVQVVATFVGGDKAYVREDKRHLFSEKQESRENRRRPSHQKRFQKPSIRKQKRKTSTSTPVQG